MNKLLRKLFSRNHCDHNHIEFRGGYIDYGVRLECIDCTRRVVLPFQFYVAINPVRREEILRDFFTALISLRKAS